MSKSIFLTASLFFIMGKEIEHKYLVTDDSFKQMCSETISIRQGYLSREKGRTVRVRTAGNKAFITIKGPSVDEARDEFEYRIPMDDAMALLNMCTPPVISKTRHIVFYEGNKWEVDVFHEQLEGLVIAEIELPAANYQYALPRFVGRNVTDDRRFYNSCLTTFEDIKEAL